MREQEAMAVLVGTAGIGYARRERALRRAGGALALLDDPGACADLLGAAGVSAVRRAADEAERTLAALAAQGVQLLIPTMSGYPSRLRETARPPHLLYVLGSAALDDAFPLAVVGTRKADTYGLTMTRALCCALAAAGMCIVSGMAVGIDAAAHEGALEAGGRTVAVLGGALDRFYPAQNRGLMERVLRTGGSVVTEYAPGVPPGRHTFLQRNRIIAGMSLGVLLTEAPQRSGAKSTVNHALDEGREVFALPGDVGREGSQLPNRLIAEGAHPVSCAQDILSRLVIDPPPMTMGRSAPAAKAEPAHRAAAVVRAVPAAQPASAEKAEASARPAPQGGPEKAVYDALADGEMDFDDLCEAVGLSSDALGAVLMMMELDEQIQALPGCRYQRLA